MGYNERYEARARASIELTGFLMTALAIAYKIATFVKTLVGRPRQAAIVRGLKRYLLATVNPTDRTFLANAGPLTPRQL